MKTVVMMPPSWVCVDVDGFGSGIVTGQRDSVQIPERLENVWKNSQSESEGNQDEGSVVLLNIIIHHV